MAELDSNQLGALANALRYRRNFGAMRQDRNNELALMQRENALKEQQNQEQYNFQQGFLNEMEKIAEQTRNGLPKDVERTQAKMAELKKPLYEALKASGGDVKKFLYSGGQNALLRYKNDLLNSDEASLQRNNNLSIQQAQKAQEKGLDIAPSTWTNFDGTVHTGSLADNIKAHNEGLTNTIYYGGSAQPLKLDITKLTNIVNADKDGKGLPITGETINAFALWNGGKDWQGKNAMDWYNTNVSSGKMPQLYFKGVNKTDEAYKKAKTQEAYANTQKILNGNSSNKQKHDYLYTMLSAFEKDGTGTSWHGEVKDKAGEISTGLPIGTIYDVLPLNLDLGKVDIQHYNKDDGVFTLQEQNLLHGVRRLANGDLYVNDTKALASVDGRGNKIYPSGWRPISSWEQEIAIPYLQTAGVENVTSDFIKAGREATPSITTTKTATTPKQTSQQSKPTKTNTPSLINGSKVVKVVTVNGIKYGVLENKQVVPIQ